ncbi:MAG: Zn-ribbon domain-containing OB-fold protein [Sporichthyaceae bacterium]
MSVEAGFIQNDLELTEPFAAALADGKLVVQKCNACGELIMYPKYRCPRCFSGDLGWQQVCGAGQLQTFTILRYGPPSSFAVEAPYCIGIVKLDEGPQLMCRLHPGADGTWDHYVCDQRVAFVPADAAEIAERAAAWFTAA